MGLRSRSYKKIRTIKKVKGGKLHKPHKCIQKRIPDKISENPKHFINTIPEFSIPLYSKTMRPQNLNTLLKTKRSKSHAACMILKTQIQELCSPKKSTVSPKYANMKQLLKSKSAIKVLPGHFSPSVKKRLE